MTDHGQIQTPARVADGRTREGLDSYVPSRGGRAMPQTAFRHTPKTGLRALPPKTPTRADLHQGGNDQEQETHQKSILPESESILPEASTKKNDSVVESSAKKSVSNVKSPTVSNVPLFSRSAGLPHTYFRIPSQEKGTYAYTDTNSHTRTRTHVHTY